MENLILFKVSSDPIGIAVDQGHHPGFLTKRGSFSKYTVRQRHHATKPENLIPNIMATPV
jgi:hypothetical protein